MTEDNAPSVIDRAAYVLGDFACKKYAEEFDHRYGPCRFHIEDAEDPAAALFDAGLLRTGRHAEVLRQLDRAESRYNTLREGVEKLRVDLLVEADAASLLRAESYEQLADRLSALLSKDGNDGT